MLTINTNVQALFAARSLSFGRQNLEQSMERLSSGLRINSAADDASGLAISDRMTTQIRGLNQASRNINDGISLLQTAEGAMQEATNLMQRGRELAVQAANDTLTATDRASIQEEIEAIKAEVGRIGDTTSFNGQFLLRSNSGATAGSTTSDKIDIQDGLRSGWLRNAEQRVIDGFGLTGIGQDIDIVYETDSGDGRVAWVTNSFSSLTREAVSQELHIDMSDFLPVDSEDGGTAPYYNDRVIAHEMVHAVMGVTMNALDIETWFQEGAAEFIQGGDERLLSAINVRLNANGNDIDDAVNGMVATLNSPWNDGGNPTLLNEQYATAYAATRFLHAEIKAAGGSGIDELMGLLSANKEDNTYALDEALAELQTVHAGFSHNSEAAFLAAFTANNGAGFDFMKAMYTSGDLSNLDTGAVGGLDADGGEVLTAETVIANGATYDENPLVGFNAIWEELSLAIASAENYYLQVGANQGESVEVQISSVDVETLDIADIDVRTRASEAIVKFDRAIDLIDANRGVLGAQMNRLEHAMANAANSAENLSAARSRILDADVVQETAALTRESIMQQAAASMLAQATSHPQLALRLLS